MEIGLTAYDMALLGISISYTLEFDGRLQEQALRGGLQE
jgi:hypothetical protein